MSIFTRLTLFIALAVIAIATFIVFTANQISEQDKLTLDYRELARKENAINRIQANILKQRIASLDYRKTSDKKALDKITHMTDIDLVITDVIMPNVDGIEVLNAMKKEYPNIPVIVISGGGRVSADMYLKSAKVLGARAIMQKPIDNDLLLKTIDEVLAESQA